jgi:putative aldouronate transport system permease protein
MALTILIAYPLSKEKRSFRFRNLYAWFFVITMLFNGGLIPWYMTIKTTGIIDTFWALILPGAVPVFNVILMLNFFKSLPPELDESALMDGASPWQTLWKIALPLSAPAVATLTLFCIVTHWNSWFDGLTLMNNPQNYPLQSYLQTVIINKDITLMTSLDAATLSSVSERTAKAAQAFVAALPVLMVYPFLQKYFAEGIMLGSVKG